MTSRARHPRYAGRWSGLFRFASTYVLILLVPLVALVVYYATIVRTDLEERLIRDIEAGMDQAVRSLNVEMEQLHDLAYFVQVSSTFRIESFNDPAEVVEVQSRLGEIVLANELVKRFAWAPAGAPRILTSESPRFHDLYFEELGSSKDELGWRFDAMREAGIIAVGESPEQSAVYVSPIPLHGAQPRGWVAIELLTRRLARVVAAGAPATSGAAVEFVVDGAQLAAAGDLPMLRTAPGDGERMIVREAQVTPNGTLRVVAIGSEVFAELTRTRNVMLLVVVVVLAVCLPVVYAISFSDRSTARRLATVLGELPDDGTTARGILAKATVQLRRLQQQNQTLATVVQSGAMREQREVLELLLSGSIEDEARLVERARALGIELAQRKIRVVVGDEWTDSGLAPYARYAEMLEEALAATARVFEVRDLQDARSTFLVIAHESYGTEAFRDAFVRVREANEDRITVAVSREVSSVTDLPRAFLEAKSALEYRFVRGFDQVLLAEEVLGKDTSAYEYPTAGIERIRAVVEQRAFGALEKEIGTIFAGLRAGDPSLFVARCVVYELITSMVESLSAQAISSDHYWRFLGAFDLAEIKTLDEMHRVVIRLVHDLADLDAELDGTGELHASAFSEVIDYVAENATDPQLTAKAVAYHFRMSVSNLSHQFKRHTGTTVSDFVTERRMARAKQLLQETDLPLAEIVAASGFGQVNSFIRRFRRETGRTPMEFRRYAALRRSP
ncbi:MAG: helix-turn-helix domain-containing protein [Spirochaetota bacterium]